MNNSYLAPISIYDRSLVWKFCSCSMRTYLEVKKKDSISTLHARRDTEVAGARAAQEWWLYIRRVGTSDLIRLYETRYWGVLAVQNCYLETRITPWSIAGLTVTILSDGEQATKWRKKDSMSTLHARRDTEIAPCANQLFFGTVRLTSRRSTSTSRLWGCAGIPPRFRTLGDAGIPLEI